MRLSDWWGAFAAASLALLMARPEPSSEPERATARSMVTARAAPIMPMRLDTSCAHAQHSDGTGTSTPHHARTHTTNARALQEAVAQRPGVSCPAPPRPAPANLPACHSRSARQGQRHAMPAYGGGLPPRAAAAGSGRARRTADSRLLPALRSVRLHPPADQPALPRPRWKHRTARPAASAAALQPPGARVAAAYSAVARHRCGWQPAGRSGSTSARS